MNISSIKLLKVLKDGTITDSKGIMKIMGIGKTQFYDSVNELIKGDYIDKIDSKITFKENPKSIVLRDVASIYNIEILLHDSNEMVFSNLVEPITIEEIQHLTDLSRSTIERSISELQSIGSIRKQGNTISIDPEKNRLYLLAKLIKTEKERRNIEPYAEIIYQDAFRTLKRVPKSKLAQGELTGFSLYSEYGIEYHTIHDYYYINDNESLKLEDLLIHSILAAVKDGDKHSITMALLFHVKNKSKMDPLTLRNVARKYGISNVWIDMEGYIRNLPVRNPELFLPWEEFEEKAKLYDIRTEDYTLPVSYPNLFNDIGLVVDASTEAYLFGGENMRLKGLKPRTKDCDIVVSDEKSFNSIVKGLKSMGYKSANESNLSQDDLRIGASDILQHPTRSRVDIFKTSVAHKLVLSHGIKKRAKLEIHGNLKLGVLSNEDVFLLKGVTLREGDIEDLTKIAQSPGFDWKIVWNELLEQEKGTMDIRFSNTLLISLDDIYNHKGIRAPFYKLLVRRVLDYEINRRIRDAPLSMKDLVSDLKGSDFSEKMIRNRIDYLERMNHIAKIRSGNQVFLQLKVSHNTA